MAFISEQLAKELLGQLRHRLAVIGVKAHTKSMYEVLDHTAGEQPVKMVGEPSLHGGKICRPSLQYQPDHRVIECSHHLRRMTAPHLTHSFLQGHIPW